MPRDGRQGFGRDTARDELFQLKVSCWADFAEITVGDSVVQKINEGLTNAKFVLVVVSPSFLRRPDSRQQLNAALARESSQGRKIVLPLIVNYPKKTVDFRAEIPFAGDKHVYTWRGDACEAALEIKRALCQDNER